MSALTHEDPFFLDALIAVPMARAAKIAQTTRSRLWYWDRTKLVRPGIRRASTRLYTFDDLVALLVTAELRQRRFSLQHIRGVVAHLQSRGYSTPLTQLTFGTYAGEIYFLHLDGSWEGDRSPDQLVLHEVLDLEKVRQQVRDGVTRPIADQGRIVRVRGRLGYKPLLAGTRIPVETIARRLGRGASDEQILGAYPDLTLQDIDAVRDLQPGG